MIFRNDIQGLRAIAVISVMLCHTGISLFQGGYVGVDIFFVLSGYLITSIITKDIHDGKFSLYTFYNKRARRILPALYVVVGLTIPFSYFLMLPDSLENYGQSVVATVFSANNILLYLTSGYWDLATEFKPLMHTWSLGIEDQFYFIIPLLLVLIWRFGHKIASTTLILLFFGSFYLMLSFVDIDPRANFYLLPFRAWELLLGSITAVLLVKYKYKIEKNVFITFIGLVFIIYSIFTLNSDTIFPSYYALLPTIGTVLILIFNDSESIIDKILSNRVFVFIGAISYSVYLWHQPIFAFYRLNNFEQVAEIELLILSPIAIILGFFTYKYVETPFRNQIKVPSKVFWFITLVISILLLAIGFIFHFKHGLPKRIYDNQHIHSVMVGTYMHYNDSVKQLQKNHFPDNGKKNILVVGNSFARDFINTGLETGHFSNTNVLYKGDFGVCLNEEKIITQKYKILEETDVLIFASGGYLGHRGCLQNDFKLINNIGISKVLYIGTKNFGYNINPVLSLNVEQRPQFRVKISEDDLLINHNMKSIVPFGHYIDIIEKISSDGVNVNVFTKDGYLISADSKHLTKEGAKYVGKLIFKDALLKDL